MAGAAESDEAGAAEVLIIRRTFRVGAAHVLLIRVLSYLLAISSTLQSIKQTNRKYYFLYTLFIPTAYKKMNLFQRFLHHIFRKNVGMKPGKTYQGGQIVEVDGTNSRPIPPTNTVFSASDPPTPSYVVGCIGCKQACQIYTQITDIHSRIGNPSCSGERFLLVVCNSCKIKQDERIAEEISMGMRHRMTSLDHPTFVTYNYLCRCTILFEIQTRWPAVGLVGAETDRVVLDAGDLLVHLTDSESDTVIRGIKFGRKHHWLGLRPILASAEEPSNFFGTDGDAAPGYTSHASS